MFGCCGCEQEKFRGEDGVVDQKLLVALTAGLRAAGRTEEQIERVATCTCPCHHDGCDCLC